MNFKLSEQEAEKIRKKFNATVDSLQFAADRLAELLTDLQYEFASIDEQGQKKIAQKMQLLSSQTWVLKLQTVKTKTSHREVSTAPAAEVEDKNNLTDQAS